MAKKEYYAVIDGREKGIFTSWDECKKSILNYKGARYKGFLTLEEAQNYLKKGKESPSILGSSKDEEIDREIENIVCDNAIAFTDGSYNDKLKVSSFGALIFTKEGKTVFSSSFSEETNGALFISTRNVAGELEGVKKAVEYAIECRKKEIKIFYDYKGIEEWANGNWKTNNDITRSYVAFIKESKKKIKITFFKVTSHTGVKYNEEVDKIAKEALLK